MANRHQIQINYLNLECLCTNPCRGPGDYRGGRDYPPPGMPGPGPDGYYDRERPPYPHFDGPDRGGFRGKSNILSSFPEFVVALLTK